MRARLVRRLERSFGVGRAVTAPLGRRCGVALFAGWLSLACTREPLSDGLPERMDCSSCHGSAVNAAPPRALDGATSTSALGVGAHQRHMVAGVLAEPVACTECHPLPQNLLTHPSFEPRPALVSFGVTATAGGAQPAFSRDTAECTNTYCHGATLSGAAERRAPVWTRVDGSSASCTACHGNPPAAPHPANPACELCHGEVVAAGGAIVNRARHIDGVVDALGGGPDSPHPPGYVAPSAHGQDFNRGAPDCKLCHGADLTGGANAALGCDPCHQPGWRTNCVYCHGGTLESSGAPPTDLLGQTATTALGVGAHTAHVTRTEHLAVPCGACHPAVTDVLSAGHTLDATPGRAEVSFVSAPRGTGSYTAPACSDIYCHGNGITNGSVGSFVPGAPLSCVSCHPAATQSAGHALHTAFPCGMCHASVVSDAVTVIAPDLHVNGSIEVSMPQGTFDPAARTCSGTICHGAEVLPW